MEEKKKYVVLYDARDWLYRRKIHYAICDELVQYGKMDNLKSPWNNVLTMVPESKTDVFIQQEMQKCLGEFSDKLSSLIEAFDSDHLMVAIEDTIEKWATVDTFADVAVRQTLRFKGQTLGGCVSSKEYYDTSSTIVINADDLMTIKRILFQETQKDLGKRLGKELAETVHQAIQQKVEKDFQCLPFIPSENIYQDRSSILTRKYCRVIDIFQSTCVDVLYELNLVINCIDTVDVCSEKWRRNVAEEMHEQFTFRKKDFMKELVVNLKSSFSKLTDLKSEVENASDQIRSTIFPKEDYAQITKYKGIHF